MRIVPHDPHLAFTGDLPWEEVWGIWRTNEDFPGSHWKPYWKANGFRSWADWRSGRVRTFGLDGLSWSLWRSLYPMQSAASWHGGPFKVWQEVFYGPLARPTFRALAATEVLQSYGPMESYIENFPGATVVTGLLVNGEVVILEGMHRCAALALACHSGRDIETDLQICLAPWPADKPLPQL